MRTVTIIAAILVAAARPLFLFHDFGPHVDASYQAVAHLLVGGLIAGYFVKANLLKQLGGQRFTRIAAGWMLRTAVYISAVEVACAIVKVSAK